MGPLRGVPRLRMAPAFQASKAAGVSSPGPRYPLGLLRQAIEQVTSIQHQPLMVEYLMLDGLNDTDQDLVELIAYLHGLPVHINLIPYNAISEVTGLIGTTVKRRRWFAAALTGAGVTTTVRYSLGQDIAAACGQLVLLETAPMESVHSSK